MSRDTAGPWKGLPRSSFITLTYDNDHLPKDGSVDVREWQLFAKKVRKAYGKFRFLACGEYGENLGRPHYHAVIFGLDWREDREKWFWKHKNWHYASPSLTEIWGKGRVTIGDVSFQSASYVAGYTMKKVNGHQKAEHYVKNGHKVRPEFAVMSRSPGLGYDFLQEYKSDIFPRDRIVLDGKEWPVPRYYHKVLEREDPKLWQELRLKRREAAAKHAEANNHQNLLAAGKTLEAREKFYCVRTGRDDFDRMREHH